MRLALVLAVSSACSADEGSSGRSSGRGASGEEAAAGTGGGSFGNPTASSGAAQRGGPPAMRMVGDECAALSQSADNTLQPADIIWAIDNSGSMSEEIIAVRENMNAFSRQIVDSGVDARIILISAGYDVDGMSGATPLGGIGGYDGNGICIDPPLGSGTCPEDTQLPGYVHVLQPVGSNDALGKIVDTHGSWAQHLRPGATTSFVVVTDDDATGLVDAFSGLIAGFLGGTAPVGSAINSAAGFTDALAGLDPPIADFSFHGIYSFTQCPAAAAIGTVYTELVNQTGGVAGDLCLQEFQPVFDEIARSVVSSSQVACEWAIPAAPPGETFQRGQVNVQYTPGGGGAVRDIYKAPSAAACGPQGGWYYDDEEAPTMVLACPETCGQIQGDAQARIDVLFGCDTIPVPE